MADTRIEDMRSEGWTDAEILKSIRSSQYGTQPWMNRYPDPTRTIDEYLKSGAKEDALRALYTQDELLWLQTKAAQVAFRKDPIAFMAQYAKTIT